MIVYNYKLPACNKEVNAKQFGMTGISGMVMPLGDLHWGDDAFPHGHFDATLKYGMDCGAMFIGTGDYTDFSAASQRAQMGNLRDSTKALIDNMVTEQLDEFFDKHLRPTVGRWVGMINGNHRWIFQDGTSSDQYLCRLLGCKYLGTLARVTFLLHNEPKGHPECRPILLAHHGQRTGGRTSSAHLKPVEDMAMIDDGAHIYAMAHTHDNPNNRDCVNRWTPDGVHYSQEIIHMRTGGFLRAYASHAPLGLTEPAIKSDGGYVEQKLLKPSTLGASMLLLGIEKIDGSAYYKPTLRLVN